MYSLLLVFPRSIRGSLHIAHTCTCIGLWPPVNDSCSFPNTCNIFLNFLAANATMGPLSILLFYIQESRQLMLLLMHSQKDRNLYFDFGSPKSVGIQFVFANNFMHTMLGVMKGGSKICFSQYTICYSMVVFSMRN
jgi:hypothetical protein